MVPADKALMPNYIVIDQRNGKFSIAGKSELSGVDYVYAEHLGGGTLHFVSAIVHTLNAKGKPPEKEVHRHD